MTKIPGFGADHSDKSKNWINCFSKWHLHLLS